MTEKESNRIKKDYLWSYQPVEKRIRQIDGEIERLRLERDATKAIQYSGMPNGQADRTSPQESYVMALEDAMQKRLKLRIEYIRQQNEIKQAIHAIGDPELELLLEYRYMECMTIAQVASKIKYSISTTNRKHSMALRLFELPQNDTQ